MKPDIKIVETLKERFEKQGGIFDMIRIAKRETGLPINLWVNSYREGRTASFDTQYVIIEDSKENEMAISFYNEPRVVSGEEHISRFGIKNVNAVKEYLKKNKLLFLAHFNGEIDDADLGIALRALHKYPHMKPDKALEIRKGIADGNLLITGRLCPPRLYRRRSWSGWKPYARESAGRLLPQTGRRYAAARICQKTKEPCTL